MGKHNDYFLMQGADGHQYRVVVTVDAAAIAQRLATRARRSKSGKATALEGAVSVTELRNAPPAGAAGQGESGRFVEKP